MLLPQTELPHEESNIDLLLIADCSLELIIVMFGAIFCPPCENLSYFDTQLLKLSFIVVNMLLNNQDSFKLEPSLADICYLAVVYLKQHSVFLYGRSVPSLPMLCLGRMNRLWPSCIV